MRNYNELKENAFNSGEKFISNYFLNLNYSFLAKGIVINKILQNSNELELNKFIDHGFNEEIKRKYLRMDNNKEIQGINFNNDYEYIKFMQKAYKRSEYTIDEDMKFEKLKILSEVFDDINVKGGYGKDFKIDNILIFLEETIGKDFSKKMEKIFIEEPIYLEQESKDSSLVPDLKEVYQGKRKFMTINDVFDIFPEFFTYGPQETFYMPISKANDTSGESVYEFLHSISRSFVDNDLINGDDKKYILTNQAHLYKQQNVLLKFSEIENEFKKYEHQVKSSKSKIEFEKLNKNLLNLMKLEENYYQLSKISTSSEILKMSAGLKHQLKQRFTGFINEIIENEKSFSNINTIYGEDKDEWRKETSHAKLVELIKSNDDLMNEILHKLNEELVKEEKRFKNLIRNNVNQKTNIPIYLRHNESKIKSMKTDETLLKEIFFSIVKKRPLHVYSDPGTGKTSNIKQILNVLGWKHLEVENAVDSETYVKNMNDDGKQLIGKESRHVRKSDLSRAKESGEECMVLYADEFAPKAIGLKQLGLAEALNKTLDDIINTPNLYFMATSNQNLSNSLEIAASLDDRFDSLHLGNLNWEDENYLQGKLMDLHFSSYNNVFELTEQKLWVNTYKELYNKKEQIFPKYFELIKNKEYKEALDGIQYIMDSYDLNTDKYDKIIEIFEKLDKNSDSTLKIKEAINEIQGMTYLNSVYNNINDKEKIISNINNDNNLTEIEKAINKKIELSKYEFQKVLTYINEDSLNMEDLRHPSNIEDIVDYVYDKIKYNHSIQIEKFNLNTFEENEYIAKEKISFTLKQILHKENIYALALLAKENSLMANLVNNVPELEPKLNLMINDFKNYGKQFVNSEFLENLPLFKTVSTITSVYLLNFVSPEKTALLKTKNFQYQKIKFRMPDMISYKFDGVVSKNGNDENMFSKYSEVQKFFDNTMLMGKVAAKMNFYIRNDVQGLNEEHEHEDYGEFDADKESINKFYYRNLINLLKEYYIANNSKDGVDLSKLFKRHISKIEKLLEKEEFNDFFKGLLKDLEKNYKTPIANAGMFIDSSLLN